jgi:hypothetical protein
MDDPIILDCDKCGANTVFGPDGLKGSDRIFALPVTWITVLWQNFVLSRRPSSPALEGTLRMAKASSSLRMTFRLATHPSSIYPTIFLIRSPIRNPPLYGYYLTF